MADAKVMFPKIMKDEGGFVDDPDDAGGATKIGVTLETWTRMGYDKDGDGDIDADDVRLINADDAEMVFKKGYWDRCKADQIINQSVAEALVDWTYTSGKWGVVHIQRILGLDDDGVMGTKTLEAINSADQASLHAKLQKARLVFINGIIKNKPSQKKFERGWKNRVGRYKFT